jgi:glycosyltransferase involved in cell wall biosynthesis
MKIALVVEHFDAMRGGAEHVAVWLAGQLAARGHEVHVVCHDVSDRVNRYRQATQRASHDADLSYSAHPPPEAAHVGIHIHRLQGVRLNTGFGLRRFGARARRWCAVHRPEIVHSLTVACPGDVYHACIGVFAALQAQAARSGGKLPATSLKRLIQQLSGRQRTLLALERRAVAMAGPMETRGRRTGARAGKGSGQRGPRRIISLSATMTRQFEAFGADPRRIVELPTPRMSLSNGSTESAAQWPAERCAQERAWFRGHYRLKPEDRVALFVGHDFRRKGLRYAIEAVARARTPWKLLVVGLGKAREYVALAEELGIGPAVDGQGVSAHDARVLFVGPTREMDRVYAAADALLLPTFYDSFGLVVLEAFAHGLPVISTENLGARELVRESGAGTIVTAPQSVAQIAAALDGLPEPGSAAYRELARRAKEASAGLSPEKYVESLLALYESVRREKAHEH